MRAKENASILLICTLKFFNYFFIFLFLINSETALYPVGGSNSSLENVIVDKEALDYRMLVSVLTVCCAITSSYLASIRLSRNSEKKCFCYFVNYFPTRTFILYSLLYRVTASCFITDTLRESIE